MSTLQAFEDDVPVNAVLAISLRCCSKDPHPADAIGSVAAVWRNCPIIQGESRSPPILAATRKLTCKHGDIAAYVTCSGTFAAFRIT